MWKIAACLALLGGAFADTTPVNSCNGGLPQPIHAYVEGCTALPCGLPQLTHAVIHLVFRSPHRIRQLNARATAYLAILPIFYDLKEQSNACLSLTNSYCPVLEGEVLKYTLRFFIESYFPPGISPTLEFNIVDEDTNQSVACIRLGIRVDPEIESRTNATILSLN